MGIFDFVKDVGEKLGLIDDDAEKGAQAIAQNVQKYDLGVNGFAIEVQGDKAVISGEAPDQETLEKAILAVGNTQGIAQVESNIVAAVAEAPAEQATFYTVQSGDNLSKVAKQFYGNANRYPEIFEANRPMLSHPDKIYPGQSLRIPGAQATAAA